MFSTAIKLILVLQFALMATVPCRCIASRFTAPNAAAAAECCRGGSCRVSAERATVDALAETRLCPFHQRKSACSGRLLPDLAPPPTSPADELPGLPSRIATCHESGFFGPPVLALPPAFALVPSRAAARATDCSLLRQHCALIV